MELSFTQKKSIRKNFGKLQETLSIPNLIEVQKNSFKEFIIKPDKKKVQFSTRVLLEFLKVFFQLMILLKSPL